MNSIKTVIVTGGRDFSDKEKVFSALTEINPDTVIQGGANGADSLARDFAKSNNKKLITFHADWKAHGKSAGPIRNGEMLKANPEAIVVAFKGGAGTENCVLQAETLNMKIMRIK